MKKSTFMLIVSIYGLLLAAFMLFMSAEAVKYFGGNPENAQELGLAKFLGISHLAFNTLGFQIRKTEDNSIFKAYCLSVAIATIGGLAVSAYNVFVENQGIHSTAAVDWTIWALIGGFSLFFYTKTK